MTHDVVLLVICAVAFVSLGRGYRQGQGPLWAIIIAVILFVLVAVVAVLDLSGAWKS